ncbi:MAG: DUF4097 family beta strand repeat protein [Sedimentisphaerales bacterium]|nr:DUF4097 family beta strand repeat protein [Sedimentisphaerales bacterium]
MKKHTAIKDAASLLLCSLLIYVPVAGCCDDNGKVKFKKTERLSAPLALGQTLYLHNNVGEIVVTGDDVSDCNVTAVITAKAETKEQAEKLAGQVSVKLEPAGDKLYIRVEAPDNKPKCSIVIDFNITVPKQTALQLETNVGEIKIADITQKIKAEANVGRVSCKEISGSLDIHTNVGEVNVIYSKTAPAACSANVKTDIGEIDFTAPPNLSAQVNLSANLGSIQTDLPLIVKGALNQKSSGTVGKGEGSVILKTNIGAVKIK